MARPRARVEPVDEAADKNARRRARWAWLQGKHGTDQHAPLLDWPWPTNEDEMTGVELLEAVAAAYAAAGVEMPIGGCVGQPFLLPGEDLSG